MSGIVGIINGDGAPLAPELLQRMTDALAFRGPDAQQVWRKGPVGFGHTMLRTTVEAQHEIQPHSLDGRVWITADARIDARDDLTRKLRAQGQEIPANTTDPEFILYAYRVWGTDCVQHLLGDFAFAIWDEDQRHLFCARDHFGVKPFYYAHLTDWFIFSNTLNCVRQHPSVSDELNEQAIGDFLLFALNQDVATTTFSDIQRLPPGHYLTWTAGSLRVCRYWQLATEARLEYRRKEEYVERFQELLDAAVSDRLRTDTITVSMSGGLDSTAVAAVAKKLLAQQFPAFDLQAHCVVYDRLFPDEERHYAGLAAEGLGLPIHFMAGDDYTPYLRWEGDELNQPEPVHNPLLALMDDSLRKLAAQSRVELTGYDGDTIMSESPKPYFRYLLKERHWGRFLAAVGGYIWLEKGPPPVGFRTWLANRHRAKQLQDEYPVWLNPSFAQRWGLPARWRQINAPPLTSHPLRPYLYRIITSPNWVNLFEGYDSGVTMLPFESRHPLADVRLVNFLLATPPVPWCLGKHLLRTAMRGILPEAVRQRPKSPLAGDQVTIHLRNSAGQRLDDFLPVPELGGYVAREAIPPVAGERDTNRLWINLCPISLNYWLRRWQPTQSSG